MRCKLGHRHIAISRQRNPQARRPHDLIAANLRQTIASGATQSTTQMSSMTSMTQSCSKFRYPSAINSSACGYGWRDKARGGEGGAGREQEDESKNKEDRQNGGGGQEKPGQAAAQGRRARASARPCLEGSRDSLTRGSQLTHKKVATPLQTLDAGQKKTGKTWPGGGTRPSRQRARSPVSGWNHVAFCIISSSVVFGLRIKWPGGISQLGFQTVE